MTEIAELASTDRSKALLTAAWMSVVLGIVMQLLSLLAVSMPSLKVLSAELVQKVSWSTLVCTGLAIGATAARSRPTWMGIAGLIAAPAAFVIARTLQKSLAQALSVAGGGAGAGDVLTIATIKSIQYGLFGLAIAAILRGGKGSALACSLIGLVFGAIVAAIIVPYTASFVPTPPTQALVAKGINELFFPVGCALILYASDNVGRRLRTA